jgi:hypothetical protein
MRRAGYLLLHVHTPTLHFGSHAGNASAADRGPVASRRDAAQGRGLIVVPVSYGVADVRDGLPSLSSREPSDGEVLR